MNDSTAAKKGRQKVSAGTSITASSTTPLYGATVDLIPTFANGSSATVGTSQGGSDISSLPTSGTPITTGAITSATTFWLRATDAAGDFTDSSITVTPQTVVVNAITPAAPTRSVNSNTTFSATATGGVTNDITWSASAGIMDSITGSWIAPSTAGDIIITASSNDDNSKTATTVVTVALAATSSITASSTAPLHGTVVELTPTFANAISVTVGTSRGGSDISSSPTSGTPITTGAITSATTYWLRATNAAGNYVDSSVTVTPQAVLFNFYDAATLKPLTLGPDIQVEYRLAGGPISTCCLSDLQSNNPAGPMEMRLAEPYRSDCQSYLSGWIAFNAGACCQTPVPLYLLDESCAINFSAHDLSSIDLNENAKRFLNGVELRLTAVPTPSETRGSRTNFTPGTFVGKTVQGCAEIFGLPRHQLYRVEIVAPEKYMLKSTIPQPSAATAGQADALATTASSSRTVCSVVSHLFICCEQNLGLEAYFEACNLSLARSVLFVDQNCRGTRMSNLQFQAEGQSQCTDQHGIWNVPNEMTGVVRLQLPGRVFSPSVVDTEKPVAVVAVADQAAPHASMVRMQFVDEEQRPFRRRKVIITLEGTQTTTVTDDDGYFYAQPNSWAHALDDESGVETAPFQILRLLERY